MKYNNNINITRNTHLVIMYMRRGAGHAENVNWYGKCNGMPVSRDARAEPTCFA